MLLRGLSRFYVMNALDPGVSYTTGEVTNYASNSCDSLLVQLGRAWVVQRGFAIMADFIRDFILGASVCCTVLYCTV